MLQSNSFTKTKLAVLIFFISTALSACATMKGFGEDVEAAGEAVQEAAEK
ncbi:entericidin A/B family lipoprotein [Alteromonas flava]|nr:entericidin A/B family lipoprotein [Alteromonas flava]